MRSPFLQGGGDTMYSMLEHNNFRYDCTWPTRKFGFTDAMQGLYPYTLDYKSVQVSADNMVKLAMTNAISAGLPHRALPQVLPPRCLGAAHD